MGIQIDQGYLHEWKDTTESFGKRKQVKEKRNRVFEKEIG